MNRKYISARFGGMVIATLLIALLLKCVYAAEAEARNEQMMDAARRGEAVVVEKLIAAGADPNARDIREDKPGGIAGILQLLRGGGERKLGWPPIFLASANGNLQVVLVLLKAGVNPNCQDDAGDTPLTTALSLGHEDVAKALLERGAQVDLANKQGRTPLFIAAECGDPQRMALLLERGARTDVRDKEGKTALDVAKESLRFSTDMRAHQKAIAALEKAAAGRPSPPR